MVLSVKYFWTLEQVSLLCPKLPIWDVHHCTHYQNLLKIKNIQTGNGSYVSVFWIIPVIVDIHDYRFEVFTLDLEIHENVDLVLGIKDRFELRGIINSR